MPAAAQQRNISCGWGSPMAVHAPDTALHVLFWQLDDGPPVKPVLQVALHMYPKGALSHVVPLGQALFAAVGRPLAGQTAWGPGGAGSNVVAIVAT